MATIRRLQSERSRKAYRQWAIGPRGARRASAASAHAKTASAPAAGVGVVGADGKPRKRIHANKQQLEVLETAFRQCRKPTSKMRAEISKAVGINGRSVQIWFQNRRAREKKTSPAEAAAVAATGPDAADAAPPSTSTSSSSSSSSSSPPSATAATAAGAASKDEEFLSIVSTSATDSGTATDYGMDGTPNHTFNSASTFAKSGVPCPSPSVSSLGAARSPAVVVTPMSASTPVMHSADSSRRPSLAFPDPISVEASSLIIGSWRRFANLPNDLVAQISLSESNLRWCVMESGYCFRIDIPLSNISEFYLEQASTFSSLSAPVSLPFGVSSASAVALIVNVCSPPLFSKSNSNQTLSPTLNSSSLLSPGSPTTLFTACEDFTESAQASLCSKHILLGTPQAIHSIFVTLSSLLPTAAVSAPRQPTIHLPALTGPAASPNPAAATGRTSQWTTAPSPSFSPVAALARTARSNSVPDALFAASLASRTGLGLVSDPAAMLHRRFSIAAASMFGNGATTTTASAAAASSPAPSSPSTAMTASRDSAVVGLLASPGLSALAPDLPQNNTLSSIWLGPTL
ncbi:hypothetical protein DFJ73DRAFT_778115 [Zopfochytrium polystomum]|nr:hypothetical protein DFJ73DRAFT_778115 [Zopfochytrium polystomum]